jgi:hypothetical protein
MPGLDKVILAAFTHKPVLAGAESPVTVLARDIAPGTGEPAVGAPRVLVIHTPAEWLIWLSALAADVRRRSPGCTFSPASASPWATRPTGSYWRSRPGSSSARSTHPPLSFRHNSAQKPTTVSRRPHPQSCPKPTRPSTTPLLRRSRPGRTHCRLRHRDDAIAFGVIHNRLRE